MKFVEIGRQAGRQAGRTGQRALADPTGHGMGQRVLLPPTLPCGAISVAISSKGGKNAAWTHKNPRVRPC